MTIKQQGGIFGRNPTFNNADVEGTLTSANADINGGSIDGVTLGTNSAVTEAQIDDININANDISTTSGGLNLKPTNGFTNVFSGGKIQFLNPSNTAGGRIYCAGGGSLSLAGYDVEAIRINEATDVLFLKNLRFETSGLGIDFSATADGSGTSSSELFDDYEEGTWSPALSYDTAGTSSFTYAIQQGYYTKVGRSVTAQFKVQLTNFSKGTASGSLNITGLPYTPVGSEALPVGSILLYDAPFSNTPVIVAIHGFPILRLLQISNNAAWANIDDPDTNSQYLGSVTYFV